MNGPHPLMPLLICPNSGSSLKYAKLGEDACLVSDKGGIAYPIIDGVIVMNPMAPKIKEKCQTFIEKNIRQLESSPRHIDVTRMRELLLCKASSEKASWHEKEMMYWESRFEMALLEPLQTNPGWNRSLQRKKILSLLPKVINRGTLLEIGCGTTSTLSDIYGSDVPNYIGLDLSFNACLLGREKFPHGLFVQASAENPPFKKDSLDLIVAYGVLHHMPNHERNLTNLLPILRSGGFFVGADPVLKPRIPRPRFSRKSKFNCNESKKDELDLRSGMSPHNDWIDWENLKKIIADQALVQEYFMEYGVLRHILISTFYDRMKIRSLRFTKILILIDKIWLSTMGRIHKALGPAAVNYAIRKQ